MSEIIKNIYRFKCEYSNSWSAVFAVKGKRNIVLIDSGPKGAIEKEIVPLFKKNNINLSDLYMIIYTHSHGDHIGDNNKLKRLCNDIIISSHEKAANKMKDPIREARKIRNKFSNYITSPPIMDIPGIRVDKLLNDGDSVKIDGLKLNVIYTPGHDTDCICIYEPVTKTLFSGDSILGGGTKSSGIAFYQDLLSYRKSLKKVKRFDIENLLLSHPFYPTNGIIHGRNEVKDFLNLCLKYTYVYDEEILKILCDKRSRDIIEITKKLVENAGGYSRSSFNFLSLHTVNTHLLEFYKARKILYKIKKKKCLWQLL